jgi:hypothetical protein
VFTLGLVNPLGIGIHGRISEDFGFALDYQWLPSIGVGNVDAGISLFTLTGRWHPGGSSFFLGAGFSYQSLYAEGVVGDPSGMGNDIPIDASVGIPQLMLGLGVLGGEGFVMGIDLALGIPLGSADVEFDSEMPDENDNPLAAEAYADQKRDIEDFAEVVLEILPATFQLNLIRIGYIF